MSTELFAHLDSKPRLRDPSAVHEVLRNYHTPATLRYIAEDTHHGRRAVVAAVLMMDASGAFAEFLFGEHDALLEEPAAAEIHEAAKRLRDLVNPHLDRLYTAKPNYPLYNTLCSI